MNDKDKIEVNRGSMFNVGYIPGIERCWTCHLHDVSDKNKSESDYPRWARGKKRTVEKQGNGYIRFQTTRAPIPTIAPLRAPGKTEK